MDYSADAAPPSGPRLTVTCAVGSPSVITVNGEADMGGLDLLRDAAERALAHHPHVVFNLAGVTFADSTFLNVLVQARQTALDQEGSVRLLAPSATVQHLLDLTGALILFPVVSAEQLKQS